MRRRRSRSRSPIRKSDRIERERSPFQRRNGGESKDLRHSNSGDVEKPNFSTSGLLVKEANTFNGITLKYAEPPEARKCDPSKKLRLYIFKGDEHVDTVPIYKQSAYLLGRERKVCDIGFDHASISSQHCVLQYRQIVKTNDFGETLQMIKLYIIDLDSSNGTFVNSERIPSSRYYELKVGDVIKLGFSTREIVLMVAS